jgi:hypothetical protein
MPGLLNRHDCGRAGMAWALRDDWTMNTRIGSGVLVALLAATGLGCAHRDSTPRALAAARAECKRAENGPARHLESVVVDDAEAALAAAEAAYDDNDDLAELLAVFAQRKAQLAESLAATKMARRRAHESIAERNVLLEVRAAEARVIAERNAPAAPPAGAAEMQPQPQPPATTTPRAPESTPPDGPQSGAPPQAR